MGGGGEKGKGGMEKEVFIFFWILLRPYQKKTKQNKIKQKKRREWEGGRCGRVGKIS